MVLGDSARGNLAINSSYGAAAGIAPTSCGGTVPVPAAVVAQYPVVDPAATWKHGFGGGSSSGARALLEQYVGGTPLDRPERYAAISSFRFISSSAPATLIIEPERDHLVPAGTVHDFVDEARGRGVDVDLASIPFADHGFDSFATGSIGDQGQRSVIVAYFRRVLGAI